MTAHVPTTTPNSARIVTSWGELSHATAGACTAAQQQPEPPANSQMPWANCASPRRRCTSHRRRYGVGQIKALCAQVGHQMSNVLRAVGRGILKLLALIANSLSAAR